MTLRTKKLATAALMGLLTAGTLSACAMEPVKNSSAHGCNQKKEAHKCNTKESCNHKDSCKAKESCKANASCNH